MIVVGIDPAQSGAACIVKDKEALVVFEWNTKTRKKQKVYMLSISCKDKDETHTIICICGSELGSHIGSYVTLLREEEEKVFICSEDAYVGRNKKTSLIVAKFAGLIAGATHNYTRSRQKVVWVQPNKWRHELIKVPYFTKREQVKKLSLELVPNVIPTITQHLNKLGVLDHITDAAGVAMWSWNDITLYNPTLYNTNTTNNNK